MAKENYVYSSNNNKNPKTISDILVQTHSSLQAGGKKKLLYLK